MDCASDCHSGNCDSNDPESSIFAEKSRWLPGRNSVSPGMTEERQRTVLATVIPEIAIAIIRNPVSLQEKVAAL